MKSPSSLLLYDIKCPQRASVDTHCSYYPEHCSPAVTCLCLSGLHNNKLAERSVRKALCKSKQVQGATLAGHAHRRWNARRPSRISGHASCAARSENPPKRWSTPRFNLRPRRCIRRERIHVDVNRESPNPSIFKLLQLDRANTCGVALSKSHAITAIHRSLGAQLLRVAK